MKYKLRHFNGAKRLSGQLGHNLCVHISAGFVLDVPGSVLCFGTFQAATPAEIAANPDASPVPFIHAWAEFGGLVYSGTAMMTCEPGRYYAINGATDIKRLSRVDLLKVSREIGLSRHLRLHVPALQSVGASLLNAAGKAFVTGANGELLPPSTEAHRIDVALHAWRWDEDAQQEWCDASTDKPDGWTVYTRHFSSAGTLLDIDGNEADYPTKQEARRDADARAARIGCEVFEH